MIDPCFALQTAIHDHLVADPAIIALGVDPMNIRAGSTRPSDFPTIIIGEGRTIMHGRADGGQFVAGVFLSVHIWTLQDGIATAKTVGAAVARRLMDRPATSGFDLDEFQHRRTDWPRDPEGPEYGHGVFSIDAVVRWKL